MALSGRLAIALAAVLWSLGGACTKILTQETIFGLDQPPLATLRVSDRDFPVVIACWRVLFAGLVLLPGLRRRDLTFRPAMLVLAVVFAVMNATFISAMALGTAANAILLQYSAPLWMVLASVFLLGERADRRSWIALAVGLAGVGVIVGGGWRASDPLVLGLGLTSGLTYATVLLFLRVLRDVSSRWITVWNMLTSGLLLLPLTLHLPAPTVPQFLFLAFFGGVQLGLAYLLMAYGLRTVSPQEAGAIVLLEPILNPLWAYLVSPATDTPEPTTFLGGFLVVGALAFRYWPTGARKHRANG